MMQNSHVSSRKDDSLYGLLSSYKSNYTFIRVLVSGEKQSIVVLLAANPKIFFNMPIETLQSYRPLRRLEIGVPKLSVKYLSPENLIAVLGPLLGFSIAPETSVVINSLDKDGYYRVETSLRHKTKVLQGVKKLINMSPHKRYEILEKYFSAERVPAND
jgi:hypothetical protein